MSMFDANMGLESLILGQPHSNITKQMHFIHLEVMRPWTWFYFIIREFHRKYFVGEFLLCLTPDFILKGVLNNRERARICA